MIKKKDKGKDKINRNKLILLIKELLDKYPPGSNLSEKKKVKAYKDFQSVFPETINQLVFNNLYIPNKSPEDIADEIIKSVRVENKMQHIREYGEYNHPGRPRGPEWDLFSKAENILSKKNLQEWKQMGINIIEHEELRDKTIQLMHYEQSTVAKDIASCWSKKAVIKMIDEIKTLKKVDSIFIARLAKSIYNNNNSFLRNAEYFFKELTGEGIAAILERPDPLKTRGNKPSRKTLLKYMQTTRKYMCEKTFEKPKNFYERYKPVYLCYLSAMIHLYFKEPIRKIERETAILRAMNTIQNLAKYYGIGLDQLMPARTPASGLSSINSLLVFLAGYKTIESPASGLSSINSLLGSVHVEPPLQENNPLTPKEFKKLLREVCETQDSLKKNLKEDLPKIIEDLNKK